ncbi:Hypothetical protein, putative [Bodo saltans]|uniref:Uncharacterized protein n=1 Tax=Bodo saltans TaxID=75058 RepID=A0A0S4JF86_BODSA|nr:Hypothetical protein, putative [Bodo saltans]|eukprot:CUG88816.1 Hypothetical protein, putative [Bodo saltans]
MSSEQEQEQEHSVAATEVEQAAPADNESTHAAQEVEVEQPAASPPPPPPQPEQTPSSSAVAESSPKKVAVVSAGHAPPQPPPRQMTREEFLRQMGLAPDDLVVQQSPSRIRETIANSLPKEQPVAAADATLASAAAAGNGDAAPEVIQDDQWVRTTVFADATLIQSGVAEQNATNEVGEAKLPPQVSPSRQRAAVASS